MMRKKFSPSAQDFIDRICRIEGRLFPDQLDERDSARMKSHGKYSWLYRPSHHIASGLVTQEDVALLSQPGKRMLSVGAHPAFLERVLVELSIPVVNILVADNDPALPEHAGPVRAVEFDMTKDWPAIGDFDRIIFPESLCIAISDKMKGGEVSVDAGPHPTDALETALLTGIIGQAVSRLRPGGIIRANGPMSHPTIVDAMSAQLQKKGFTLQVDYRRFLLTVRGV